MRKDFSAIEQRISDVATGVDIVLPVVSLIRNLEIMGNAREPKEQRVKTLTEDVKILDLAISCISDESILGDVCTSYNKNVEILKSAKEDLENHDKSLTNLEDQVSEYLSYADSYWDVDEEPIAKWLLTLAISKETTDDMFLAILIILLNDSVDHTQKISDWAREIASKVDDKFRKQILLNLDEFCQDKVCELIRQGA